MVAVDGVMTASSGARLVRAVLAEMDDESVIELDLRRVVSVDDGALQSLRTLASRVEWFGARTIVTHESAQPNVDLAEWIPADIAD